MNHSDDNLEDKTVKTNVGSGNPNKVSEGNKDTLRTWDRGRECCVVTKKLGAFCPYSET